MLLGKRITQRILLNSNSPITTYQKYTLAMTRVKRSRVTRRRRGLLRGRGRSHKPVRISRHRRSKVAIPGLRWRQAAHKKKSRGRSQVRSRNFGIARGKRRRRRNHRGRGGGRGGGGRGGGGGRRGRRNAGVVNGTKAVGFPSSFHDVFRAEQRYQ